MSMRTAQLAALCLALLFVLCSTTLLLLGMSMHNLNPGTIHNDHTIISPGLPPSSNNATGRNLSPDRCAILFFGVPRCLKDIGYAFIKRHILDANPQCDVFVHTYNVTKVVGSRAGEEVGGSIDINDIYLLLSKQEVGNNETKLDTYLAMDTEELFQNTHNLEYYRKLIPTPSAWKEDSMDNMVRQWHSIQQAWKLMRDEEGKKGWKYSRVGLFRPDVLYTHPISIANPIEKAVVPKMMYTNTMWGGTNDRMFYGTREFASIWATERFSSLGSYLDHQKGNPEYAAKRGLHSEDFLHFLLTKKYAVPLMIKPICFKRIRSSGMIMHNDCRLVGTGDDTDKTRHVLDGVIGETQMHSKQKNVTHSVTSNLEKDIPNKDRDPRGDSKGNVQTEVAAEHHSGHNGLASAHRICVIVRTHPHQADLLPITLLSLTQQSYTTSAQHNSYNNDEGDVALSIFVVNTDPINYAEFAFMQNAANDANRRVGHAAVTVLGPSFHTTELPPVKNVFGYDVTDRVLDMLLLTENHPKYHEDPKCTHFMFTNGDNFYPQNLLESILPAMKIGKQLIAWDFITHHKRKSNVISVEIKRRFVDLGAVLVTREAILNTEEGVSIISETESDAQVMGRMMHKRFLPNGIQTSDIFARDYFFFKEIYDQVGKENVEIIHQVLFVHQ
eukprot:CAMPEP_0181089152 /NCGR_PEP_ID=MMETSP1071-20121207/7153_1 /TAXON_ID=35127 /ORGANISM="Thalassiosira sp., Strain NH16" /LENGTH=668 /DNA_ID=CAMNT_0023171087 /DNA_START=115 /DNA_END=2121 /DNA_ORIENTATION=+